MIVPIISCTANDDYFDIALITISCCRRFRSALPAPEVTKRAGRPPVTQLCAPREVNQVASNIEQRDEHDFGEAGLLACGSHTCQGLSRLGRSGVDGVIY